MTEEPIRILIVEARFYEDLADALLEGATQALTAFGAEYDVVTVPGALEIPAAIALAEDSGHRPVGKLYDGYVALGTVIRGETYHFEIVSNESARGIMDLAVNKRICIGNGILTTEDEDQAWARARISESDKGGGAARAALTMIGLKQQLLGQAVSGHPSRSVARLAAVQALYQMEVSSIGVEHVIREFCEHRFDRDVDGETLAAADEGFFADLVRGVVAGQAAIDTAIVKRLAEGWRLERLDATVRAILRAGAFELKSRPDVPTEVAINEYVEVAKSFFEGTEPGFVNGALDGVARDVRPG